MAKWNTYAQIDSATLDGDDLLPVSDESAADGSKSRTASVATLRSVLSGATNVTTADPGASDDETEGFRAGSIWLNSSTPRAFVCSDASEGAAVWLALVPVPAGGTTGQVLAKASNTDFDLEWVTP